MTKIEQNLISQEKLRAAFEAFEDRLKAVVKNKGGKIKYMLLIFVKYNCGHQHIQQIFKLDRFFIENYYKMCVAIIIADPVHVTYVHVNKKYKLCK